MMVREGHVKERVDPLWKIVGEKVRLQGYENAKWVTCPKCGVRVELPAEVEMKSRFVCGLCGAAGEVVGVDLVSDDGSPEVVARLAE